MKNKSRIVVISFLTIMIFCGNALALTDEELAVQRLQDRISTMEKSMSDMQQELYRNSGKNKGKQPVSQDHVGAAEENNRAMNGKIEELDHNISTLATKLDKIIADIDFRIAALEKKIAATPVAAEATAQTATPTPAPQAATQPAEADAKKADAAEDIDGMEAGKQVAETQSAQAQAPAAAAPAAAKAAPATGQAAKAAPAQSAAKVAYDKAYEFIRLSKYDEAEKAFKEFIAGNKGHELVGNAYFWLGESYYSRQNYQAAAVNFLKVYQEFPKNNKAPDSLYKLGLSFKGEKKEKEACASFSKLKKDYSSADKTLIAKVDAERKTLKCK